jgi:hypothetical protein
MKVSFFKVCFPTLLLENTMTVTTIFLDVTSANLYLKGDNSDFNQSFLLLARNTSPSQFLDHEENDLRTVRWAVWIERNSTAEIVRGETLGAVTYTARSNSPGCSVRVPMIEESFDVLRSIIQTGNREIELNVVVDGVDSVGEDDSWDPTTNPSLPVLSFEFCVSFPVPCSED